MNRKKMYKSAAPASVLDEVIHRATRAVIVRDFFGRFSVLE